jgi:cytidylate kinase
VGQVFVNGDDVTRAIRTEDATKSIRFLDGVPEVREHLTRLQRETGARRPTVAEGRDMGTVVFPNAKCKLYLTASIEERARRRAEQLALAGYPADVQQIMSDIRARDESDSARAVAPLRPAPDALVVDTTNMTEREALSAIVSEARAKL